MARGAEACQGRPHQLGKRWLTVSLLSLLRYDAGGAGQPDVPFLPLSRNVFRHVGTRPYAIVTNERYARGIILAAEHGNWRFRIGLLGHTEFTVADICDGILEAKDHGFLSGDGPVQVSSTISLPGGLTPGVDQWVSKIDDDHFRLGYLKAAAEDGLCHPLQHAGDGVHSVGWYAEEFPTDDNFRGDGGVLLREGEKVALTKTILGVTVLAFEADSILSWWLI